MNKARAQREATPMPEKKAEVGRVFKFSLNGVPVVDPTMEARLKAAARMPHKDRRYPMMIEAPDV